MVAPANLRLSPAPFPAVQEDGKQHTAVSRVETLATAPVFLCRGARLAGTLAAAGIATGAVG